MKSIPKSDCKTISCVVARLSQNGYILMFFVTVLQKNNIVYECQEYQTLDETMQTLDMSLVCRKLVQPYKRGLGT